MQRQLAQSLGLQQPPQHQVFLQGPLAAQSPAVLQIVETWLCNHSPAPCLSNEESGGIGVALLPLVESCFGELASSGLASITDNSCRMDPGCKAFSEAGTASKNRMCSRL